MSLLPWLASVWAPLGYVLFEIDGHPFTPGGLLLALVGIALGWVLTWPLVRLLLWKLRRGTKDGDDAPPVLLERGIRFVVRASLVVLGCGMGLDAGDVVTTQQFLRAAREALTASLFEVSGTQVSVLTLLTFLVTLGVTWWLSRTLRAAMRRWLAIQDASEERVGGFGVAERLAHYLLMVLGTGLALELVGIDLSALFAAGAVFAVGIGFAMQNIAQNFVSGVIVMVERAIKPGDILKVEGRVVRVSQMGIRSTVVRTRDDEDLIVPNSTLAQSTVTNFTLHDRSLRIRATVGVAYGSDLDKVKEVLQRAAEGMTKRVRDKRPLIMLLGFGSSSIDFEVSVWVADPWASQGRLSELNFAVWRALRDAHITIAFPQLDLHLDPAIAAALGTPPKE